MDRYYGRSLDFELSAEGMGVRALFVRVKNLPPDAALWRVQPEEERDVSDVKTIRTDDPNVIRGFFDEHFAES